MDYKVVLNMNNNITLATKDYNISIHFDSRYEEPEYSSCDYYDSEKPNHFAKDSCKELVMTIDGMGYKRRFYCPILISHNHFKVFLNYESVQFAEEETNLNDIEPILIDFKNENYYKSRVTNAKIINTIKNIEQTKRSEEKMKEEWSWSYKEFIKNKTIVDKDMREIKRILIDLFENKKIVEIMKHRMFFEEAI